jgi:hypothetical protein
VKARRVFGIIAIAVMVTGIGVGAYLSRPSRITAALLNVTELPSSLRNSECSSLLSQDTITTCSFEIDPADASHLIAGWPYSSQIEGTGSSDELGWGLKVGKPFLVSVIYEYSTDQGEGPYAHINVSLMFNAERNRGIVTFFGL